jgi:hypothetical protein
VESNPNSGENSLEIKMTGLGMNKMIDTAAVKFPIELPQNYLMEWDYAPFIPHDHKPRRDMYTRHEALGEAKISGVYYPKNPGYPNPLLRLEVSLPMVLFGNNAEAISEISEVEEAIQLINEFTDVCSWLPPIDIGQGTLSRIDLCCNHQVGDLVQDYIRALYNLTYPQRKTKPYPGEGVQYQSKVAVTKFYNKGYQCRHPSAKGILRQETVLRKTYYLERRMGISQPTLRDITKDWVIETLQKDLDALRLNDRTICNRELALEILQHKYGWNKGNRLHSHLLAGQTMTLEQMIASGASRRSIQRDNKLIADADISLALTEAKVPLPPLRIEL